MPDEFEQGDEVEYEGIITVVVTTWERVLPIFTVSGVSQATETLVVIEKDNGWKIHENSTLNLAVETVLKSYIPIKYDRYYNVPISELTMKKKKLKKPIIPTFKLEALDALVIDTEVKDEIIAVLKQHKNGDKLFTEWGLAETIEYGKGMTFLFYGPPGTGKTWGAHCISKVVGQELLSIGAAEIQSSEPGAANRNIQEAFAKAKKEHKVLFLDECDSLITSRSDVGMVIASEINTLLTEIEKCENIVILATNRAENLDEALERRIGLIVEFPEPNHGQRIEIFKRLLPKKMPLNKDVSPEKLADYKLTGGQIKNVILQAARLAISEENEKVHLHHFESAIKRVQASKNLLGSASRYIQVAMKDGYSQSTNRSMDKVRSVDIDTDKVRDVDARLTDPQ